MKRGAPTVSEVLRRKYPKQPPILIGESAEIPDSVIGADAADCLARPCRPDCRTHAIQPRDRQELMGPNSDVPVEDIPQCTLGYVRGTTQIVDTERLVSRGPLQVEHAAKYLGTIYCPAPAVHIFAQRQQRAQSRI
jgi:hypothetical protein